MTTAAVPTPPSAAPAAPTTPVVTTHEFELRGIWTGGLGGTGRIETGDLETNIAVPRELGGPGRAASPEDLLIGAAASCYLITLAAVLKHRGIAAESLSVASSATFTFDGRALRLTGIEHRPKARLSGAASVDLGAAYRAAEAGCMVSRALSVPVTVRVD